MDTRPDAARRPSRFVLTWLCASLALAGLVAGFNVAVDPYLVFGTKRIAGFNAKKPAVETHADLAKRYAFARARPRGLLIGDSKADIGLDPDSPAWPADARPVFNHGVPGTSLEGMLGYLRQDLGAAPVRHVLVMLDLQGLLAAPLPVAGQPSADPGVPFVGPHTNDLVLSTLSVDALRASVTTLAAQSSGDGVDMSGLGSTGEGGFRAEAAADGERALFAQKDQDLTERFSRLATYLAAHPDAGAHRLDLVAEMIGLCRAHGAALDLVIGPVHADYLDIIGRAGLWPRYEAAKARLAILVDSAGDAVRLWDFEGYDGYSGEAVPASGGTRWFWEPTHFKKVLGEQILAAIYQNNTGYGVRLTAASLAGRLQGDEQSRTQRRQEANADGKPASLSETAKIVALP